MDKEKTSAAKHTGTFLYYAPFEQDDRRVYFYPYVRSSLSPSLMRAGFDLIFLPLLLLLLLVFLSWQISASESYHTHPTTESLTPLYSRLGGVSGLARSNVRCPWLKVSFLSLSLLRSFPPADSEVDLHVPLRAQ